MIPTDDDFKTLTKAELIEQLYENVTGNKAEASALVDSFFEIISSELEQGKNVKISGFGNFELRDKVARPGRNPRTGETKVISARRVVTFHPSQKLKKLVEEGTREVCPPLYRILPVLVKTG